MHIGAELENGRKNAARRIHKGRRDRGTGLDQSRVSLVLRFFFSSLFHSLFLPLPPHWFPTIGTRSVLARAHGPCWIAITRIAPATRNACANRVFHDAPRSTEERRFHAIAALTQIKIDPMDRNITISNLVYPLMFTVFHVSRVSLTPWRRRDVARCWTKRCKRENGRSIMVWYLFIHLLEKVRSWRHVTGVKCARNSILVLTVLRC